MLQNTGENQFSNFCAYFSCSVAKVNPKVRQESAKIALLLVFYSVLRAWNVEKLVFYDVLMAWDIEPLVFYDILMAWDAENSCFSVF